MWELYFVRSGHATFTIGDQVHAAGPGSFLAVPPGTSHAYRVSPGEVLELLYLGVATDE
jgi:mannose-6-phosphate isomerase-like protein (cupin superfamily)